MNNKTDLLRISALAAAAAVMSCSLTAQDPQKSPIRKQEITPNVVLYQPGQTAVHSNMVAVRTSKGTVVIDSLQFPEVATRVRDMIEKEWEAPIACLVNSHGAFDHTGGNRVFRDVPIYGHEEVKAEMTQMMSMVKTPPGGSAEMLAKRLEGLIQAAEKLRPVYPGDPREIDENLETMRKMIADLGNNGRSAPEAADIPGTLVADRYVLKVGNTTFEMVHNTPSYSKSDLLISIPEEKTLIVGDIFNHNRLPLIGRETNLEAWESLFSPYLAEDSEVRHFVGTHGDPLTREEIREQLKYVRMLFDETKRLKAEGKTAAEAQKELALERFSHLKTYNPYFYGTGFNVHDLNIGNIWAQLK